MKKAVFALKVRNYNDFENIIHRIDKVLPRPSVWSVCEKDLELITLEVCYWDYEINFVERLIKRFR